MIPSTMAALVRVGETLERRTRFTESEIATFSRGTLDENPLHLDAEAARRSGFGGVIASGQHSAAMMMGMLATHYSRDDDGVPREMLCLNMNLAFKEPVPADTDVVLRWRVATIEWKEKLQGLLVQLDGSAQLGDDAHPVTALIVRGTILVKHAPTPVQAVAPPSVVTDTSHVSGGSSAVTDDGFAVEV